MMRAVAGVAGRKDQHMAVVYPEEQFNEIGPRTKMAQIMTRHKVCTLSCCGSTAAVIAGSEARGFRGLWSSRLESLLCCREER